MKKLVSSAAFAMLAAHAFAQGTVAFQNGFVSRIFIYDNATLTTNPVTSATLGSQNGTSSTGVLDVGLVWGTSAGSVNTLAGIETIGSSYPGEVAGTAVFPVVGTNPNDTDYFQVYAWDSSYGDSLAGMNACLAAGGVFGAPTGQPGVYGSIGAPLAFTLGAAPPLGPGTPIFLPLPGYFNSSTVFNQFTLMSSPEPGTITLAGLGSAAVLLLRRRK